MILSHTHQSYLGIDWFPRDFAVPPWIMVRLDFHVKNQFWYTHCWMALYFFLCIFQIIIEVKICFFSIVSVFWCTFSKLFPKAKLLVSIMRPKLCKALFPPFLMKNFFVFQELRDMEAIKSLKSSLHWFFANGPGSWKLWFSVNLQFLSFFIMASLGLLSPIWDLKCNL